LAKIAALVAQNLVLDGVHASKRFEARIPSDAPHRASIVRSLGRMDQCATQVLAFNLNTLADSKNRPLVSLLLSQYYVACGYSGNLIYARVIEAELDKQGKLSALHAAVEARAKKPWADILKNPTFYRTHLYAAACEVAPDVFPSLQDVDQALKEAERGELYNAIFLIDTILAVSRDKKRPQEAATHDAGPRRVWPVDRGQSGRLSQLQALVEEAAIRGQGKIWSSSPRTAIWVRSTRRPAPWKAT